MDARLPDDDALEEIARYFAALGATMRLKILNALRGGERNVTELVGLTGATQANASKHLALLAQHGLVAKTPRGTSVYYRIADPSVYRICDMVCGRIGARLERLGEVERVLRSGTLLSSRRTRRSARPRPARRARAATS